MAKDKGKKSLPLKVIVILFYIGAALSVLGGLIILLGGIAGTTILNTLGFDAIIQAGYNLSVSDLAVAALVLSSLIIGGIVMVGFGALYFFVGHGISHRRNWARIVAIVLMGFAFLKGLAILATGSAAGLINVVISGVIGWYLWFGKDMNKLFH